MSGYAVDFSKSNNALDAEAEGRYPASVLARRLGVKPGAIRTLVPSSEWHHSSKYFNIVDYFDERTALEMMDQLRAWREPAKDVTVFENCSGSFLEWSGTRNHPHATEIHFGPVRATKKGQWFTLELPSGAIRKGEHTRGFHLFDTANRPLTFNA